MSLKELLLTGTITLTGCLSFFTQPIQPIKSEDQLIRLADYSNETLQNIREYESLKEKYSIGGINSEEALDLKILSSEIVERCKEIILTAQKFREDWASSPQFQKETFDNEVMPDIERTLQVYSEQIKINEKIIVSGKKESINVTDVIKIFRQ